ncbi:MAG: ELKS/Rab6-interacting/CAST family protein [Candidatus Methanofastidiosum sp.]|nr:ELKS/Rab6-interacting/CAST family protein [Methanofastidiosum sp.]
MSNGDGLKVLAAVLAVLLLVSIIGNFFFLYRSLSDAGGQGTQYNVLLTEKMALDNKISLLESQILDKNKKVSDLESEIRSIKSQYDAAQRNVDLKQRVIDNYETRVKSLEDQLYNCEHKTPKITTYTSYCSCGYYKYNCTCNGYCYYDWYCPSSCSCCYTSSCTNC